MYMVSTWLVHVHVCVCACVYVCVCVCVCVCVSVYVSVCNHSHLPSLHPGQSVDLSSEETSIHIVGALMKDLLRSVPGGILLSSRYTEFVATNDIKDVDTRVHHIQK